MPYKDPCMRRECDRRRIKKKRNRLIQILGGRCVRCFTTKNLELHHRTMTYRDINHMSNLTIALRDFKKDTGAIVLLCETCHDLEHGHIGMHKNRKLSEFK